MSILLLLLLFCQYKLLPFSQCTPIAAVSSMLDVSAHYCQCMLYWLVIHTYGYHVLMLTVATSQLLSGHYCYHIVNRVGCTIASCGTVVAATTADATISVASCSTVAAATADATVFVAACRKVASCCTVATATVDVTVFVAACRKVSSCCVDATVFVAACRKVSSRCVDATVFVAACRKVA